jgi:hypothetical protein
MSELSARADLRNALAVIDRGEEVAVSPTVHDLTSLRLLELADELRAQIRPDAKIEWRDSGAYTYVAGLTIDSV